MKITFSVFTVCIVSVMIFVIFSCTNHKAETLLYDSKYPADIENILVKKCASAGCHSDKSYENAAGLNLSTWDKLFEGSMAGATAIPYSPHFSTLCYYTNIDTSKGLALQPTMPYNAAPLSDAEYNTLSNWILNGAPDKSGFVKFSDYVNKPKLYICNRGCDVVTVMDPVSGLAMRYVDVGITADVEGPCMIKVSHDKLYWYVIFIQGNIIQKYRTADNVKVGELNIGSGIWSSMVLTNDSKHAFISNTDINGTIAYINTETMQLITTYQSGLRYPYGLCINGANNRLYATAKEGNYIYNIDISNAMVPVIKEVSLETNVPVYIYSSLNPYQILLSKDESCYFVTCNKSSELRIIQTSNDSLLGTYSTGSNPAEMVLSASGSKLYMSCMGVPGTNKKSGINVFDYTNKTFLPEIYAGHDTKGIRIDEGTNKLFVANRNVSAGGPAAHHAPVCDGKNGYITAIDLQTHLLIPDFKAELSVDPYFIAD